MVYYYTVVRIEDREFYMYEVRSDLMRAFMRKGYFILKYTDNWLGSGVILH